MSSGKMYIIIHWPVESHTPQSTVLYTQTSISFEQCQFACALQMSHFQRSTWHTVTWMALLTFVLNNVSLLNLDSLFFYRSFIGGNSMFNTRLTQSVLTDRKHCTAKCPALMVKLYQHLLLICPLPARMSTAISFLTLSRVPTTSPCDTHLPSLSS